MTYQEWERGQTRLSPASPEAHAAEVAWNAAIKEARRLVSAAASAEEPTGRMAVLLDEELLHLTTGLGTDF